MAVESLVSLLVITSLLRNDIMRFSVLGFRSDLRIELQAPVVLRRGPSFKSLLLEGTYQYTCSH